MDLQPKKQNKGSITGATQLYQQKKLDNVVTAMPNEGKGKILSDVNGSYTGTPKDHGQPIQDADDL